ncbi:MAG: hypothetical protein K6F35_02290 [Lachnospiraceae bacterium]|nr:hypothetical protein [Lachnospiraceae bacterium]
MSKENVMKFKEQMMKDKEIQKKIEEAFETFKKIREGGAELDEKKIFEVIAPIAKEAGFEFTFEEFAEVQKAVEDGEINLKDMKAVAGGSDSKDLWWIKEGWFI